MNILSDPWDMDIFYYIPVGSYGSYFKIFVSEEEYFASFNFMAKFYLIGKELLPFFLNGTVRYVYVRNKKWATLLLTWKISSGEANNFYRSFSVDIPYIFRIVIGARYCPNFSNFYCRGY